MKKFQHNRFTTVIKVKFNLVYYKMALLPCQRKQADLKARYELDNKYLQAPLTKGQVVGKIVYQLDGKDVAIVNLQALEDVQEGGFFGKGWDWLVLTVKRII